MIIKRRFEIFIILFIIIFIFLFFGAREIIKIEEARAQPVEKILYVGGDGPNNYTKIQDAIGDAKDGFTIFVYSGIYYENVVIDKRINLIGENKRATIIDGSGGESVVKITVDGVNIKEFTVQNGKKGIKMYNNCKIENNIIYGGSYGIWLLRRIQISPSRI